MADLEKVLQTDPLRYPLSLIATPDYLTGATDQYTSCASEMALVHNFLIRHFNTIYIQTPHIPSREYFNFIGYCQSWYDVIHGHHTGEENMLFPEIEAKTGEKGLMEVNVKQHDAFEHGLGEFGNYLTSLKGREKDFSPARLMDIMDSFKGPLHKHLQDEIPTILGLARYGDTMDLKDMFARDGEAVMKTFSITRTMPGFWCNHDETFEGGIHAHFPPGPKTMLHRFNFFAKFSWWYGGFWKFGCVDSSTGKPKPLLYATSQ